MTRSANIQDAASLGMTIPAAPLESILCTDELLKRPQRPPDHKKENSALVALATALADSPRTILQTLADKVLEILDADSAGLSLLTKDGNRFYWAAIAGAWRPHLGGGTPRNFGPCGDVLDRNATMLFTHWERRYPYLRAAMPLAEEGLLVRRRGPAVTRKYGPLRISCVPNRPIYRGAKIGSRGARKSGNGIARIDRRS